MSDYRSPEQIVGEIREGVRHVMEESPQPLYPHISRVWVLLDELSASLLRVRLEASLKQKGEYVCP